MEHRDVQMIAKRTMEYIKREIRPGMALTDVRALCEDILVSLGADSFWYWDVGAFVFAGDETNLSVSGKTYRTSERIIGENDIVTIDLSPQIGDIWGDYARTIIIENGKAVDRIDRIKNEQWREGLQMEERLHEELYRYATPETTFEEVYLYMNRLILEKGWINLDFAGNLGHSIEKRKENRIYIEKGNDANLGEGRLFTFEPHIGKKKSGFGYKKENIYYFAGGVLKEL